MNSFENFGRHVRFGPTADFDSFAPIGNMKLFDLGGETKSMLSVVGVGYGDRYDMTLGYKGFVIFEGDDWYPANLTDFGFWMDFYIGDDRGSDAFTVLVCTPSWFSRERAAKIASGRNVIFMSVFDRKILDDFLREICAGESGKSIETTMLKIDGFGEWEYRYRS